MVDERDESVLWRSDHIVNDVASDCWKGTCLVEKMLTGDYCFASSIDD